MRKLWDFWKNKKYGKKEYDRMVSADECIIVWGV